MILIQLLSLFLMSIQLNANVFAQYLVEVLESGTQHPILRCEASGALFGPNVLDFSIGPKAVGCAIYADPINACGPVTLRPLNDTVMFCDTYFAMVARGNCSFTQKALNVQRARPFGFDAMIVYNDPNKSPNTMSPSEHAEDVTIPSVMITYSCMKQIMGHFSASHGYMVTMKASPGYYDLIKYLVPFVVIVGFCFVILLISLIIRLCRERRKLAKKRLSRANLKKIPIKKYKKGEGPETCAICLEDFVEGEKVRVLPCRHAYHTKCVDPWLTKNRKVCPICKRKVGPSNGSDSDSDTERNTVNNSVATAGRDSDPLIRNVYNISQSSNNSRPSILNIRWLSYNGQQGNDDTESRLPTNSSASSTALQETSTNDENRRPILQRMSSTLSRAFNSIRHKFTRTEANSHARLENDDTMSTIILDPDIDNQAQTSSRFVAENNGYNDGTSLTTVHSNQYFVQVEVEPVPPDHE